MLSIPTWATISLHASQWNVTAVVCEIHYTCCVLTYLLTYLRECNRVNPCMYPPKYHSLCVPYCTSSLVMWLMELLPCQLAQELFVAGWGDDYWSLPNALMTWSILCFVVHSRLALWLLPGITFKFTHELNLINSLKVCAYIVIWLVKLIFPLCLYPTHLNNAKG